MAQATDKGLQLRCNVSRKGNTITWTIEVWSASHAWDDAQTLHWSGATNGSANYHASAGYGESRKMYSRTVSITGTPGKTYTLWTSISGAFNGANPTPGGVSATIPVSAPNTPSAPTITRVSDTKHTVAWSRSASSSAPITSQQVQRSEWNGSAWTNWVGVANVNTTYTNNGNHSWTDPGTKANRRYRYRIKAANSSGEKYSTAVDNVYTTPGVPSSVSAVKTSSNGINITVAQTVTFSQHQTVLRYSTNGGTSWTALTTLNSGVNTYLWTSPPSVPSVLIDAAVRVNASGAVGNSLLSATRRSNSVGLTVPPNPPGGLTPNGVVVASGEGPALVSWAYNSADSSEQSAFEVEWNLDPSMDPWIVAVTGTTETSVALPAWLTESPGTLHWRVRTKGAHPNWSAFSASALITISDRPVAAVTSPSATHESSRVTIGWEYSDNEETAQSMWEVELLLDGQVIESKSGSGSASSVLMNTSLVDDTEYQVRVRVRDGHGLWSDWDQATFTTDFPVPPKPSIFFEWNKELGQMAISVLNPDGAPLVSHNVVQRSIDEKDTWQDVIEVAYNGVGFDKTVPLGTRVWYRVQAWSEVPSVSYSEEILYEDGYGEFGEPVINLFTNPNLVGDDTWAEVRRNLNTLSRRSQSWTKTSSRTLTPVTDSRFRSDVMLARGSGWVVCGGYSVEAGDIRTVSVRHTTPTGAPPTNAWAYFANVTAGISGETTRGYIDHGDGTFTSWATREFTGAGAFQMPLMEFVQSATGVLLGDPMIEAVPGPPKGFFDGSVADFTADPDMRTRWLGAPNNSESVMEIERVRGLTGIRCVAGVSTWEGRPAIRLIATEAVDNPTWSYAYAPVPAPARAQGTILGTRNVPEALSPTSANLRTIEARSPIQPLHLSAGPVTNERVRKTFSSLVETFRAHWGHGGAQGSGDVWWTDIGLFAGEYEGEAFGGDTTGSDLVTYGWNGEPNNSTSFRIERGTAPVEHTLGYWSAGTDLNQLVKMQVNLSNPPFIDLSSGLASKTLHYFSGRKSPVETTGEATARTGAVSFMVMTEEELHVARAMALLPAPHLFRLPDKTHVWASIGTVTDKRIDNGAYQITFQITEVDYNG